MSTHVCVCVCVCVQVNISAPSSTFTPVACPTERGFVPLSVESFAATASIAVYERTLTTDPHTHDTATHSNSDNTRDSHDSATNIGSHTSEHAKAEQPYARESENESESVTESESEGGPQSEGGSERGELTAARRRRRRLAVGSATLVLQTTVRSAALEFGGEYRCVNSCQGSGLPVS